MRPRNVQVGPRPVPAPAQFQRQPDFSASQISAPAHAIQCQPLPGDLYCDLTEVGCHGSLTQHWIRKLEFLPEISVKMRRHQCQDAPTSVPRSQIISKHSLCYSHHEWGTSVLEKGVEQGRGRVTTRLHAWPPPRPVVGPATATGQRPAFQPSNRPTTHLAVDVDGVALGLEEGDELV